MKPQLGILLLPTRISKLELKTEDMCALNVEKHLSKDFCSLKSILLLKARAIENLCYVLGCNRSGVDGVGGHYSGNSALIDYKGFSITEAEPGANQTVTATLVKDKLDTFRQKWPLYLDFD